MKIWRFLIVLFFLINCAIYAQDSLKIKDRKILYGVYFDEIFYFSSYDFRTVLHPYIMSNIHSSFQVGVGPKYILYRTNRKNANHYGGTLFVDYYFIKRISKRSPISIFSRAEYEFMSLDKYQQYSYRKDIHLLWLGLGVKQPIGKYSSINIFFQYNVLTNPRVPEKPVVRFSFVF